MLFNFLTQKNYKLKNFIPFREGDWDGLRRELSQKGGKLREFILSFCSDQKIKIPCLRPADKDALLKGYLLIRGLHSREEVLCARKGFAFYEKLKTLLSCA